MVTQYFVVILKKDVIDRQFVVVVVYIFKNTQL